MEKIADLRIRLAKKFRREPQQTIADKIQNQQVVLRKFFIAQKPKQAKQKQAFQRRFKKLGRVAQHERVADKVHSDGTGGDPSVKFAVQKIPDPSKKVSGRNCRHDKVGKSPEINLIVSNKNPGSQNDADESAVIAHPAQTDKPARSRIERIDDCQRVVEIIRKIIKKDISQPTADDHAYDGIKKEVQNFCPRKICLPFFQTIRQNKINRQKSRDVHQRIPLNRKRADTENIRTDPFRKMLIKCKKINHS